MPLTSIPKGVAGPLPEDFGRFVLGRSSLSFQIKKKRKERKKEISVVHGVVSINTDEVLFSLANLSLTFYCATRFLTGHRSLARGLGTLILSIVLEVKPPLNKALLAI